jgi:hypothetical protein
MFDEETTMKTFIGTAVVLVGTMFGVSNSMANPSIGCGCSFVLTNQRSVAAFFFGTGLEHEEITLTESGNVNADCKVDLTNPTGKAVNLDKSNTGFNCLLTGLGGSVVASTADWKETISASGQTTLSCHFH